MNTRHYTINHDDNVDVVWFRRPRRPNLSKELHEADREMARFENNIFFQYDHLKVYLSSLSFCNFFVLIQKKVVILILS